MKQLSLNFKINQNLDILHSVLYSIALFVIIGCTILIIFYCSWMINRGFEITDESYYLLKAIYPGLEKYYWDAQQWLTGSIWQLSRSLVSFRASGLFLLTFSACLLAIGVISAFARVGMLAFDKPSKYLLVIFSSLLFSLLYCSIIYPSPSYNLLATAGTYASVGFFLWGLNLSNQFSRLMLLLLVGIALSIVFVSKPPAGINALMLISLWNIFFGTSFKEKILYIFAIFSIILSCILFLIVTQTTIAEVKVSFAKGIELFRIAQNETNWAKLARYCNEMFQYIEILFKNYKLVILAFSAYLLSKKPIFAVATIISVVYICFAGKYQIGGLEHHIHQMEFLLLIFLSILILSFHKWKSDFRAIVLIGGLTALPFSIAIGTGNSILFQILFSLASWGSLLAVLSNLQFENRNDRVLILALCIVIFGVVTSQIITSGKKPYRVQPLIEQSEPVNIGVLGTIKVDIKTKKFINDIEIAKKNCSIVSGTPFLGIYNVPGIALVLDTVPLVVPWLISKNYAETLLSLEPTIIQRPYTLAIQLNDQGRFPELPMAMKDFPNHFKYCGEAIYPYGNQKIQIWWFSQH